MRGDEEEEKSSCMGEGGEMECREGRRGGGDECERGEEKEEQF